MRYLTPLLLVMVGCASTPPDSSTKPQNGFIALEYTALSSLNMGPRETASYLFSETCDNDFFSSISHVGSDGVIAMNNDNALYRYYQTYHGAPVWNTRIEILWEINLRAPTKASLLVVDPTKLLDLETSDVISPEEALSKIETLFLAADEAENYEIVEPAPVYYYNSTTNRWHYGWGSTVVSHHSGYDHHASKLILVNLVYTIIIDASSGEQLLVEFNMKN